MRASQEAWEIVDMLWKLSGLPADPLESAVGPAAAPVAATACAAVRSPQGSAGGRELSPFALAAASVVDWDIRTH